MKKKIIVMLILSGFCAFKKVHGGPVITFFMQPYPLLTNSPDAQAYVEKLKKPGKIAKEILKSHGFNSVIKGVLSTYAGYLTMSNYDGQTTFPRKHVVPIVYLLVTNKITPIIMAGNTIHHWEIEQGNPAKMYKAERIHNESEELYYWLVQEVPLPEDGRLPLESITILAKPKYVFIPEGITLTSDMPNLLLPHIFIKKGININSNALYMLNLRQFFGHLHPAYKKEVARYLTHVQD